jgi:hypothetical protein
MENIVGIFHSLNAARQAYDDLVRRGISEESLSLLSRNDSPASWTSAAPVQPVENVRATGARSTDTGKAAGTIIGGATGGAAGFAAGATIATLMVPGLGLITAAGLGAAALLGLTGAAAGAKLGDTVEEEADPGASPNQVEFYRQLLQRGYSLVNASVRGESEITKVREVFREHGSEDIETLRRDVTKAA